MFQSAMHVNTAHRQTGRARKRREGRSRKRSEGSIFAYLVRKKKNQLMCQGQKNEILIVVILMRKSTATK